MLSYVVCVLIAELLSWHFVLPALYNPILAGNIQVFYMDRGMILLIGALPGLVSGAVLDELLQHILPKHWVKISEETLVSMRDGTATQGSFIGGLFLTAGMMRGGECFSYFVKGSGGSLRPGSVMRTSDTQIFEQDRTDGELLTYEWRMAIPFSQYFVTFFFPNYRYKFYVPKGSVKLSFNVS